MFNFIRLSDGGIDRLDNVRSEVSILAAIGKKLLPKSNIDFEQFSNHETLREAIANIIPGMDQLKDIGVAKKEFHIRNRLMHTPNFKTPTKKACFAVHPIPTANKNKDNFPFLLASIRSEGQFNSIIYEEKDSYRHNAARDALLISKKDMLILHIKNGNKVDVISQFGKLESLTVQEFDLPKGNVLAYYPEANALTEHNLDPRSKTPNFKSVAVKITKC